MRSIVEGPIRDAFATGPLGRPTETFVTRATFAAS